MNRSRSLRTQLALLFALILVAGVAGAQSLAVVLEPLGPQSLSDPIEIAIRFENRSNTSVVVYPALNTVPSSGWPDNVVMFSIVGPDGNAVPFRGDDPNAELKRKLPEPCDFREVPPGAFFGYRLVLNKGHFAHEFKFPGVYRVSAEVEFKTAELLPVWIDRWHGPNWESSCAPQRGGVLKQQAELFAKGVVLAEEVELVVK